MLNRTSSREYILPDDSLQLYNEDRNYHTKTQSHRFSARIDYEINEKHALVLRPRIGLDYRNSVNLQDAYNLYDENTYINRIQNETSSSRESTSFANSLNYRYKFDKEGRAFSTFVYTSKYNSDSNSDLVAVTTSFRTAA